MTVGKMDFRGFKLLIEAVTNCCIELVKPEATAVRKRLRNNIDSKFSRTGHFPVGQDGVRACVRACVRVCVCLCES